MQHSIKERPSDLYTVAIGVGNKVYLYAISSANHQDALQQAAVEHAERFGPLPSATRILGTDRVAIPIATVERTAWSRVSLFQMLALPRADKLLSLRSIRGASDNRGPRKFFNRASQEQIPLVLACPHWSIESTVDSARSSLLRRQERTIPRILAKGSCRSALR